MSSGNLNIFLPPYYLFITYNACLLKPVGEKWKAIFEKLGTGQFTLTSKPSRQCTELHYHNFTVKTRNI